MTMFFINLILCVVLGGLLLALGVALGAKHKLDREKLSPFECGFTPKTSNRVPLSLRFFLIAIVFLIFDVELVLIFPMILSQYNSGALLVNAVLIVFVLILLGGLYYELNQGSLNWAQ